MAFTRERLNRWLAGERAQLWNDLHNYSPPRQKRRSEAAEKAQRQQRCMELCRDTAYSKSCSALTKPAPFLSAAAPEAAEAGGLCQSAGRAVERHPRARLGHARKQRRAGALGELSSGSIWVAEGF